MKDGREEARNRLEAADFIPYFVLRKDADRFLPAFDEYKSKKSQPG